MDFLFRLRDWLLHFLFPKSRQILELEALSSGEMLKTLPQALGPELDENTLALFDYTHPVVKEIVWEVKYNGNTVLAHKMGEILNDHIRQELADRGVLERYEVVLVPMPVSDKRRFERGWNQAELLAKAVKACDIARIFKYLPRQLAKVRHTESQTKTASKSEREHNLIHSMKVINPLSVEGKYVVLIDDVLTTGSTFAEARRALREAGAKKILCIAVAH